MTIHQDQTAQIDGRTVAARTARPRQGRPSPTSAPSCRRRSARPARFSLDFTRPVPGTLLDGQGRGIGLTHRLPGTGHRLCPSAIPISGFDPDRRALELTTTRSDLNTQDRMPTGEYLGVRLADLGFTGKEDFEISATIPDIPGLKVVGQFGLYAGSRSDTNIRGGLIRWPRRPIPIGCSWSITSTAIDTDIYEVGLMTTGDDLRLTLRRIGGRYSLVGRQPDPQQLEHAGDRPPRLPRRARTTSTSGSSAPTPRAITARR